MKNCILYLAHNSEEDLIDFRKSLTLLYENYLRYYPTDVIIYHENNCLPYIEEFNNIIPHKLIWVCKKFILPKLKEDIPEFFPHPTHGNGPISYGHPGFSIGYRHMCDFFSGAMYSDEMLLKYDYYLRLDTDSFILERITYNLFDHAYKNNLWYGYIKSAVQKDHPAVIKDLWKITKEYADLHPNIYKHPYQIPEGMIFYTNFEIGYIPWFVNEYLSYYEFIQNSGGIYTKRWGDSAVKYMGINMLMPENNQWGISGILYQHGGIFR